MQCRDIVQGGQRGIWADLWLLRPGLSGQSWLWVGAEGPAWGCGAVAAWDTGLALSPDQEHGPGGWGAFRVGVMMGLWGSVPELGVSEHPMPHSTTPNRLQNPSVWGDKSLSPNRRVWHIPLSPRALSPSSREGAEAFPARAERGSHEKLGERELRRLGGEWRADSRVDFCLSGYYTVDLKRQMTAVAEEAIIESAMKH